MSTLAIRDPAPGALKRWLASQAVSQAELADILSADTSSRWSQAKVSRVVNGNQSMGWDERHEVAAALQLPSEDFGVGAGRAEPTSRPRNRRGFTSNLSEAAEILRASGRPKDAVAVLADELEDSAWRTARPKSQRDQEALIELLLALATAKSDVTPASELGRVVIPLVKRARELAAQLEVPSQRLTWSASMRLGNELRKTGKTRPGTVYLEQALLGAPSQRERHLTLVPYARGLTSLRRIDDLQVVLREVQELSLEPENHCVSLHPLAALDLELRVSLVLGTQGPKRTQALRDQIDAESIRSMTGHPPQWELSWAVSSFAHAVSTGDLDRALFERNAAHTRAAALGLSPSMQRLRDIDSVLDRALDRFARSQRRSLAVGLIA